MKKLTLLLALVISSIATLAQTPATKEIMQQLIKENFAFADSQYRYMITLTPADRIPQSYDEKNSKFIAREISWWCTGFYPGSLWYIYEQTNDEVIKKAERVLHIIEPNQSNTRTHDLGFMMYCSFGNAYRLTKN